MPRWVDEPMKHLIVDMVVVQRKWTIGDAATALGLKYHTVKNIAYSAGYRKTEKQKQKETQYNDWE